MNTATRTHELKADHQGRYRPRIGQTVDGREKRFNLGKDRNEASWRYAAIQKLYRENCTVNGQACWSPLALDFAEDIAKGKRTVEIPPLDPNDGYDDPKTEYAQMVEVYRQYYPSVTFAPSSGAEYAESLTRNDALVAERLKALEAEMRALGALPTQDFPTELISGTLHEAFNAYSDEIRRDGPKLEGGQLKTSQVHRLERVGRFTPTYIGRLESAGASPGIDLVDRLARALGTTTHDLLPTTASPDTLAVLRERAARLFNAVVQTADRETLQVLCPLLARFGESPDRSR